MKKLLILMGFGLMTVVASAQVQSTQYEHELKGSLNYWVPDFDLYDYAYGVDIEYRNWLWDPFGFAVGAGVSSWEVQGGSSAIDRFAVKNLNGQLTTIPVGPSFLCKIADQMDWNLTAEAGARYVFAQSAVDYRRTATDEKGRLDIDGNIIAILGLDYERYFDDGKSFFVGAGYQVDIDEGAIRVSDIKNTPNKLEAFFARIGTKIRF